MKEATPENLQAFRGIEEVNRLKQKAHKPSIEYLQKV